MERLKVGPWLYLEKLEPGAKAKLNKKAKALVQYQLEQAHALHAEDGWGALTDDQVAVVLLAVECEAKGATDVDDVEVACRSLTEQFELAEGEIEGLEDEVNTLKERIAVLEGEGTVLTTILIPRKQEPTLLEEADKGMQCACYDCVYRGTLADDCHSRCLHPMAQYAPGRSYGDCRQALRVDADPHGEKMGWFVWPINFDPVWLRHCDGFKQKGVANDSAL